LISQSLWNNVEGLLFAGGQLASWLSTEDAGAAFFYLPLNMERYLVPWDL